MKLGRRAMRHRRIRVCYATSPEKSLASLHAGQPAVSRRHDPFGRDAATKLHGDGQANLANVAPGHGDSCHFSNELEQPRVGYRTARWHQGVKPAAGWDQNCTYKVAWPPESSRPASSRDGCLATGDSRDDRSRVAASAEPLQRQGGAAVYDARHPASAEFML